VRQAAPVVIASTTMPWALSHTEFPAGITGLPLLSRFWSELTVPFGLHDVVVSFITPVPDVPPLPDGPA